MSATLPQDFKPLIGTESVKIDGKRRILISKAKRERLGESFVLVVGKLGCLVAYPEPVWSQLLNEIFAVPTMNPAREQYTRLVLAEAEDDFKFDAQGRMVIPESMCERAKLKDSVRIVGCGDRIEIWAEVEWEKFSSFPVEYEQKRRELIEAEYEKMVGRPNHVSE